MGTELQQRQQKVSDEGFLLRELVERFLKQDGELGTFSIKDVGLEANVPYVHLLLDKKCDMTMYSRNAKYAKELSNVLTPFFEDIVHVRVYIGYVSEADYTEIGEPEPPKDWGP